MKRSALALVAAGVAVLLVLWTTEVWRPLGDAGGREVDTASPETTHDAEASSGAATTPVLAGRESEGTSDPLRPGSTEPGITGPRITGRVVDAAGLPVAAARVIAAGDLTVTTFAAESAGEQGGKQGGGTTVATADGEGRFAIAVSKDAPFHLLWADAPGRGYVVESNVAPGADVLLTLEPPVTLSGVVRDGEGTPIPGAVVKARILLDCRKLEAEVVAGPGGEYRIEGLPSTGMRPGRPWRGYFVSSWFEVTAEGFAPLLVENVLAGATAPEHRKDFTLARGAVLAGRVEDGETGRAVAGATVALHSIEGMQGFGRGNGRSYSNPYAPRLLATTTSGEDGSFLFEHVPCLGVHGTASHNASPSGRSALGGVTAWRTGSTAASEGVDVAKDGERMEVVLKLWPSATLTGRVVEKDGTPRGNVSVSATVAERATARWIPPFLEGVPRPHATSEEGTGRFRMEGVPASATGTTEVSLALFRLGRSPRVFGNPTPGLAKASVKAGETVDVGDLVLDAVDLLPVTTVVVLRPDGTPAFGAQVTRGRMMDAPRSDAEGRLEWVWGRPRDGKPLPEVQVLVRAPGFAPTPATLFPPGSGKEEVTVTLLAGHRLAGQVVGADGAPAVGVAVSVGDGAAPLGEVFPEARQGFVMMDDALPKGRVLPLTYGSATTDEHGRFALEDLPDGPYHVLASRARRVPAPDAPAALRATASGVRGEAGEVLLRLPEDDSPASGALEGRVVEGGSGRPVVPSMVWVRQGGRNAALATPSNVGFSGPNLGRGTIDPSGAFRVPTLAVGTYSVRVEATGLRPSTVEGVEIRPDETTHLPPIAMDRGATVSGRVNGPAATDWTTYTLWFRAIGSTGARSSLEKDGSFRVTGLEPGTWQALLSTSGWGDKRPPPLIPAGGETLAVREGETEIRFDVTWTPAGIVSFTPADPRLPPPPFDGKKATAEQERFGAASRVLLQDAKGRVLFDQTGGIRNGHIGEAGWHWLLPGRYAARLEMPDGEVREETIDLAAGATVNVTFGGK